jgi:hypothetical protein
VFDIVATVVVKVAKPPFPERLKKSAYKTDAIGKTFWLFDLTDFYSLALTLP